MSARSAERGTAAIAAVLLVLATFLAYGRAAEAEFLRFDDGDYVTENPFVRTGLTWPGVRWAWTRFHSSNWHPLTWLSHMLDVELFGLDPAGHHVVNVALHAATAVLLFLFFDRTTGARMRSALVAGLFALHPLRVQSVVWVSERKDVLAGSFFALVLLLWARYAAAPSRSRYLLALALFALGLCAKPSLVTVPFVLLLVDYWPLGRWSRATSTRLLLEKLSFLVLALLSSAVTLLAQHSGGALTPTVTIPLAARVANAASSALAYVGRTLWPAQLCYFHPHPALVDPLWRPLNAHALSSGAVLLLATSAAILLRRARPAFFIGWCWTLVMLVPVIGLVQVGEQAWAERYAYLPLVGIYVAVLFAFEPPRALRLPLALALLALLAVSAVVTRRATLAWLDSRSLYERALAVSDKNYMAETGLANLLRDRGEIPLAREHYQAALAVRPTFAPALYGLGLLEQEAGDLDRASALYERAIASHPGLVQAHLNLGAVLGERGELDRAIEEFATVLELVPDQPDARGNLERVRDRFRVLVREGRADAATAKRLARVEEILKR